MKALPSNCLDCPFARHLYTDRFACGNSVNKVVCGREFSTSECHDAVRDFSHRYFQPLPLPDLQELEPEWVCDRIHLSLNWLDVYDRAANDGEIAVEVRLNDVRIGYLRRDVSLYP